MKKVVLVNDHIHFGGGGDAVLQLERQFLEKQGFNVFLIGFGDSKGSEGNTYIIDIPLNEKLNKFLFHKKLEKQFSNLVNKIAPDLIHIHLVSKFPVSIYSSNALKKTPVIQTLHGPNLFCSSSWGGLKNSAPCELDIDFKCVSRGCVSLTTNILYYQLKNKYWSNLKSSIDVFHCPSLNILNSAVRLGLNNAKYIPLGIDEVFNEIPIRKKISRPTLLYVGAVANQKGVQFLLPALQIIKERFPNVLLRIAGKGHLLEKLKGDALKENLDGNLEFLGFIEHTKIREFYLSGDVFLMPSIWHEQFGLVGPEALACETPCVASNLGGIPEWLRHNENGLLVPPQDFKAIAEAVIKILSDPEKKIEMGKKGRAFVLKEFTSKKYEENILKLINGLL